MRARISVPGKRTHPLFFHVPCSIRAGGVIESARMNEEQLDLWGWLAAQPPCLAEVVPAPDGTTLEPHLAPVRLTRTDPACNVHRFYSLELATSLFGEWGVVRHWGRIGSSGRIRTDWYDKPHEAESAFQDLLRMKHRRGYAPEGDR